MSVPIPDQFHDLFTRPILAALTTLNPDGGAHTVPVWADYDGEHARVNLRIPTKKSRNLEANPRLTLLLMDPNQAGHWVEVQGRVAELRDEAHGAREHIDQLSLKYTGKPYQPWGPGHQERLMVIVEAIKVNGR